MMYRLFFIILCLLTSLSAMSGEQAETLLQEFERLDTRDAADRELMVVGNKFLSQLFIDDFIDQQMSCTDIDSLRIYVYYWGAELMYDSQDYARSVQLGLKAAPLFRTDDLSSLHSDCLNIIAIASVRTGNYDTAATYARQCYDIDKQVGDHGRISSTLNSLAAIYMSARQPEQAERYVLRGIDECRLADNPSRLAVLHGMASEVYHHLHRDTLALQYATLALDMERQLQRKDKIAIRQAQRASALIALHRYDEALDALNQAIPQFRADGNDQSLGISDIQMGNLLLAQNRQEEAVQPFAEAIDIFTRHHDPYNESAAQKGMAEALRHTDPAQALHHLERYNALHDSIYDSETGMLLTQYQAGYDYEQLQTDLAAERHWRRWWLVISVVVLLLVVVAAATTYHRSLRRRREIYRTMNQRIDELMAHTRDTATAREPEADTPLDPSDAFLLSVSNEVTRQMGSGRRVTVESLAYALSLSPYQLRQRLAEATDVKPQEFIQGLRLKHACTLLRTQPTLNISEVAYQCGYEDKSNFTRAFKRMYDMTPTDYVKQNS